MHSLSELRIVLLGRSGDGKSSTLNTIFKETSPTSQQRPSATSSDNHCFTLSKDIRGKTLRITEIPGLFEFSATKEEFQHEVEKRLTDCAPGPHAFIIILKVGRYTAQEERIFKEIKDLFGEGVMKYVVLLFTHGDELDDDQTIEEFAQNSMELQDLVKMCGGRVHVIDNKYWKKQQDDYRSNRVQVEKLLSTVEEMVKKNRGQCYRNEMLQAVERKKHQGKITGILINIRRFLKKHVRGVLAVTVVLMLIFGVQFVQFKLH